jgi:hypothetical protein
MKSTREMLRHAVATVAYRGGKAVRDAPQAFAEFRAGPTSRTAAEILSHMGDLFDGALTQAKGVEAWHESGAGAWDPTADRFFRSLAGFDAYLASDQPIKCSEERLLQGPIADALTHIGQLTMLRRLAGAPVRGESYANADIAVGRVGREQAVPRREFD